MNDLNNQRCFVLATAKKVQDRRLISQLTHAEEDVINRIILFDDHLVNNWKYNADVESIEEVEHVYLLHELLFEWRSRMLHAGIYVSDADLVQKVKDMKSLFKVYKLTTSDVWLKHFKECWSKRPVYPSVSKSFDWMHILRDLAHKLHRGGAAHFLNLIKENTKQQMDERLQLLREEMRTQLRQTMSKHNENDATESSAQAQSESDNMLNAQLVQEHKNDDERVSQKRRMLLLKIQRLQRPAKMQRLDQTLPCTEQTEQHPQQEETEDCSAPEDEEDLQEATTSRSATSTRTTNKRTQVQDAGEDSSDSDVEEIIQPIETVDITDEMDELAPIPEITTGSLQPVKLESAYLNIATIDLTEENESDNFPECSPPAPINTLNDHGNDTAVKKQGPETDSAEFNRESSDGIRAEVIRPEDENNVQQQMNDYDDEEDGTVDVLRIVSGDEEDEGGNAAESSSASKSYSVESNEVTMESDELTSGLEKKEETKKPAAALISALKESCVEIAVRNNNVQEDEEVESIQSLRADDDDEDDELVEIYQILLDDDWEEELNGEGEPEHFDNNKIVTNVENIDEKSSLGHELDVESTSTKNNKESGNDIATCKEKEAENVSAAHDEIEINNAAVSTKKEEVDNAIAKSTMKKPEIALAVKEEEIEDSAESVTEGDEIILMTPASAFEEFISLSAIPKKGKEFKAKKLNAESNADDVILLQPNDKKTESLSPRAKLMNIARSLRLRLKRQNTSILPTAKLEKIKQIIPTTKKESNQPQKNYLYYRKKAKVESHPITSYNDAAEHLRPLYRFARSRRNGKAVDIIAKLLAHFKYDC